MALVFSTTSILERRHYSMKNKVTIILGSLLAISLGWIIGDEYIIAEYKKLTKDQFDTIDQANNALEEAIEMVKTK